MDKQVSASDIELRHDRAVSKMGIVWEPELLIKAYTIEAYKRWRDADLPVAINEHLITREQIDWLAQHNLTLEGLLRGDFRASERAEVEQLFCRKWNALIGTDVFGFPEENK